MPLKRLALLALLLCAAPAAQAAPGYVSLKQEAGVWWFVDADGKKFFSTGVNCVGGCFGHYEKSPIPAKRKDWIVSMLKAWNFNTAGNWSSPSVYDSLYVADQIYHGFSAYQNDAYDEILWTGYLLPHLKDEIKPFLKLRTLIGYFIDNEHKWDEEAVFKAYLALPKGKAGSLKLVDFLRRALDNDPSKLKSLLGLQAGSFEAVPASKAPEKFSEEAKRLVLKPWRSATAGYFYGRYADELRKLDPDHLILGVRWAGFPDLDLFTAVSARMDVDSVNDYNRYGSLRPSYWEAYKRTGKPMIISEWSYSGYPKAGEKSLQFIEVYTQKARGIGYRKYTRSMAAAPFMVGSHWFLWTDYDHDWVIKNGNYFPDENMGLVSADEKQVYSELVEACKAANAEIPAVHAAGIGWRPRVQPSQPLRPAQAFRGKIDGDLSDWPASLKIPMGISDSLVPRASAGGDWRFGMDPGGLSIGAFVPDESIEESGQDWSWQSDNISLKVDAVTACPEEDPRSSYLQIHPSGGGKDKKDPYAFSWYGGKGYQVVDEAQLAVKKAKGGFVIEARIPASLLKGYPGKGGETWKVSIMYEDIDSVSETWWEGSFSLPASQ